MPELQKELLNDILDFAHELFELIYSDNPDLERGEYFHERIKRKVESLRGLTSNG